MPRQDPTHQLSLRGLQLPVPLKPSESYTSQGSRSTTRWEKSHCGITWSKSLAWSQHGVKHQDLRPDPHATPSPCSPGNGILGRPSSNFDCSARSLNQRYLDFPVLLYSFGGKINPIRKFPIWSLSCASTHGLAHPAHPILSWQHSAMAPSGNPLQWWPKRTFFQGLLLSPWGQKREEHRKHVSRSSKLQAK